MRVMCCFQNQAGISSEQIDASRHDHDVYARSLAQEGDPWKLGDDEASVGPSRIQTM